MTAHILGSSLNELLAVLGLLSQEASPAAAPEVRSRGSTAGLQPRHCMDQLLCEARGKIQPALHLLFIKGSHELKNIKVAKWKLIFSNIWIVGKKKFHAFKRQHLYGECTRGISTGRGRGEMRNLLTSCNHIYLGIMLTTAFLFFTLLDGKNQVLLALLKCTGKRF